MSESAHIRRLPFGMLLAVVFLCIVGLVCIRADDPARFNKQLLWCVLGTVAMAATVAVPYRRVGEASYILFAVALVLLVAVFVLPDSIAAPIKGARRWIRLGPVSFQPSELAKIACILALAWYLRYRKNYRRLWGLVMPFLVSLLPMGLVLIEPDLGTSLLFLPTLFAMLFLAGAKARHLVTIVALGVLVVASVCVWEAVVTEKWPPAREHHILAPHQRTRIMVWLTQGNSSDPVMRQNSYQFNESLLAIGGGGVTGHGLDQSIYAQYDLLPEDNTDFIFSLIANQWGFLGCLAVVAAYLIIFAYGVEIAASTADPFGRLLAVGVVALFAAQMFINVGMAVGMLPITGMTLPFVSYGGSSLLINFIALGLLINVGQRRPIILAKRRFDWDEDEGLT